MIKNVLSKKISLEIDGNPKLTIEAKPIKYLGKDTIMVQDKTKQAESTRVDSQRRTQYNAICMEYSHGSSSKFESMTSY